MVRVDVLARAIVAAGAGNASTTEAMDSPTAGAAREAFRSYAAWLVTAPDAAAELTRKPPITAKPASRFIYLSNITVAVTFSNGEALAAEPFRWRKSRYRELRSCQSSDRSSRRCGLSSGTSGAGRSSATAKSLGAPDIPARPGRSATSLPIVSASPGGGWYGRAGSWRRMAGKSRHGGCAGRASRSETGAVNRPGIRNVK